LTRNSVNDIPLPTQSHRVHVIPPEAFRATRLCKSTVTVERLLNVNLEMHELKELNDLFVVFRWNNQVIPIDYKK
jgi:hypothetical protein